MSKARCKNCDTIIESVHRHDWVKCKCLDLNNPCSKGIYLDGGHDYIRCGGNQDDFDWIEPKFEKTKSNPFEGD